MTKQIASFVAPAVSAVKLAGFVARTLKANDFAVNDVQGRHKASQAKPFAFYNCMAEDKFWQKNINERNLPALPSLALFERTGYFWPVTAGDKALKVSAEKYEAYKSFVHIANGLLAFLANNSDAVFVGVQLFAANEKNEQSKAFRGYVQAFAAKDKACHKSFKLPADFGKNSVSYAFLDALRDIVACSSILTPVYDDGENKRTTVDISTKYKLSDAWRETIKSLKPHYDAYLA